MTQDPRVRIRKLALQTVRAEPWLVRFFAPLRATFTRISEVDEQLRQSVVGSMVARRLTGGALLIVILPYLAGFFFGLWLLVTTHLKAVRLYGGLVTWALEGILVLALVVWGVTSVRASRRAEATEPQNEELQLAPPEVEERLASGDLRPWDLMHDGAVWKTLDSSPQFEFSCEVPLARLRLRSRLLMSTQILGWTGVVVAFLWWRFG